MPKNIISDVLPRERKTIRNVHIRHSKEDEEEEVVETHHSGGNGYYERRRRKGFPKFIAWILGIVVICFGVFALTTLFTGATLVITPKTSIVSISSDLKAKRGFDSTALGYERLTISKTLQQSVATEGEEEVEERAFGKIVIYNDFSASTQRLIKNTRFEAPNGLVYRIGESVTLPGKKDGQPGSVTATVYADSPGEEYNIDIVDFTVPGFKSDAARYKGFYAKSLEKMSNGFKGVKKVVDSSRRKEVSDDLRSKLKSAVLAEVVTQVPESFILFDGASKITFESLPDEVKGNAAILSERINFEGYLLKENDLNNAILSSDGVGIEIDSAYINDLSNLAFALISAPKDENDGLTFTISGESFLVWKINETKLKVDLVGRKKSEIDNLLKSNTSIAKTNMTTRPFWRSTLPSDADSIKIVVKVEPPSSRNGI